MSERTHITSDNYITIQGWMVTDLNLKGNELIIYAAVYGFSQLAGQKFSGSLQYLADWTNSTKQGVIKALKSLMEKGYIIKNEYFINSVKFCEYCTAERNTVLNKVERGIKQSLPNNIDNNIDYINTPYNPPTATPTGDYSPADESAGDTPADVPREGELPDDGYDTEPKTQTTQKKKNGGKKNPEKHRYGEHQNVLLSDEEVEKLRERYPVEYQQKIEDLSDYMKRVGKKYADHYLTLLKWLREDADKQKGSGGTRAPEEEGTFWERIDAIARGEE